MIKYPLESNIIRRGLESNTFGMVRQNADGTPRAHQGWDFYAPEGTQCYAVAAGQIVYAGERGSLGNLVVLKYGESKYAAYAHLSRIDVALGAHIDGETQIGLAGCSGNAAGMKGLDQHLHFELRTVALPGLGLAGRVSPATAYGKPPYHVAVPR